MEGRHCFEHLTVEENLLTGAFTRKLTRGELKTESGQGLPLLPPAQATPGELGGLYLGRRAADDRGRPRAHGQPSMILLDEPSMGLAPQIVEEIFDIVRDLNRDEGVSFLLAEQNTNVALRFADYGYMLENGRVVMDGAAKDLAQTRTSRNSISGCRRPAKSSATSSTIAGASAGSPEGTMALPRYRLSRHIPKRMGRHARGHEVPRAVAGRAGSGACPPLRFDGRSRARILR